MGKNPCGQLTLELWFYGVMVSTQDSESCDPSSNLGRTYTFWFCSINFLYTFRMKRQIWTTTKQNYKRARPGFEPGTSRTLSENHTPRPTSQVEIQL